MLLERPQAPPGFRLSADQVSLFETFGYLHLRGLFAPEIERVQRGFEQVVAQSDWRVVHCEAFYDASRTACEEIPRMMIPDLMERSPDVGWLPDDERVRAITTDLLGEHQYLNGDGNLFNCDTHWHNDGYWTFGGARHLKFMLYLDPLTRATGALRVMPGSQLQGPFRDALHETLMRSSSPMREVRGVHPEQLPAHALEVEPGDLIVLDYDTFHASFGGRKRRRLVTMDFGPLDSRMGEVFDQFVQAGTRVATPKEVTTVQSD
jgi:ectoine hydroxylase-related dioxygenase (phytanoyl-CoA dioxygenase family)